MQIDVGERPESGAEEELSRPSPFLFAPDRFSLLLLPTPLRYADSRTD